MFLTGTVMFAVLAGSRHAVQVGPVFAAFTVWGACQTVVMYLSRIFAPTLSVHLATRPVEGRRWSLRLARLSLVVNVLWLTAVAVVTSATDLTSMVNGSSGFWWWTALFLSRLPAALACFGAAYVLENTDAKATRVVFTAAACSLAVCIAVSFGAIPAWGGIGLLVAETITEMTQAATMAALVQRAAGRRRLDGAAKGVS